MWPDLEGDGGLKKRPAKEIALQLLGVAQQGLKQIDVDESESNYYLGLIEERIVSGVTGAIWQRKEYQRRLKNMSNAKAVTGMVQRYMEYSAENIPVATWSTKAR